MLKDSEIRAKDEKLRECERILSARTNDPISLDRPTAERVAQLEDRLRESEERERALSSQLAAANNRLGLLQCNPLDKGCYEDSSGEGNTSDSDSIHVGTDYEFQGEKCEDSVFQSQLRTYAVSAKRSRSFGDGKSLNSMDDLCIYEGNSSIN